LFISITQMIGCEERLRNDLDCVSTPATFAVLC